jgi:hypothetical protein
MSIYLRTAFTTTAPPLRMQIGGETILTNGEKQFFKAFEKTELHSQLEVKMQLQKKEEKSGADPTISEFATKTPDCFIG